MFNGVAATRENSERILELLEEDRSPGEKPGDYAARSKRRSAAPPPVSADAVVTIYRIWHYLL